MVIEVTDEMVKVFCKGYYSFYRNWLGVPSELERSRVRSGITAVLALLLEQTVPASAEQGFTLEEIEAASNSLWNRCGPPSNGTSLNGVEFSRRLREELASKTKSPEERFKLAGRDNCRNAQWSAVDSETGRYKGPPFNDQHDAEIYRLGLIAALKEAEREA